MSKHVLVIGPAEEASEMVVALRDRHIEAWSDRIGRAALDLVSFDWADALVVIDPTPHLEAEHIRPVMEFPGIKLLCASAELEGNRRAELIDRGLDAVTAWPAPPTLIAAMVDRFLTRGVVSIDRPVGA